MCRMYTLSLLKIVVRVTKQQIRKRIKKSLKYKNATTQDWAWRTSRGTSGCEPGQVVSESQPASTHSNMLNMFPILLGLLLRGEMG